MLRVLSAGDLGRVDMETLLLFEGPTAPFRWPAAAAVSLLFSERVLPLGRR